MIDEAWIRGLPKAELHIHVEGTLEPELMLELAERNGITTGYSDADHVKAAYVFDSLQSFLDIYYAGCAVLRTASDFYDLTWAYLERAAQDGVRHVELFFDPQTHTARGVAIATVIAGIHQAAVEAPARLDISVLLIPCLLRHLSPEAAIATWDELRPHRDMLAAVGLDSAEVGHPPAKFAEVFQQVRDAGLAIVAHAGEEGPPSYIWEAIDVLGARRVDHGIRCLEDPLLVDRLVTEQLPLTVCPLSNVRLQVFASLAQHNLPRLLERGLTVTINSDDPAYFGGYIGDNFIAVQREFSLTVEALVGLVRNSFQASFLDPGARARHLVDIDQYCRDQPPR